MFCYFQAQNHLKFSVDVEVNFKIFFNKKMFRDKKLGFVNPTAIYSQYLFYAILCKNMQECSCTATHINHTFGVKFLYKKRKQHLLFSLLLYPMKIESTFSIKTKIT